MSAAANHNGRTRLARVARSIKLSAFEHEAIEAARADHDPPLSFTEFMIRGAMDLAWRIKRKRARQRE